MAALTPDTVVGVVGTGAMGAGIAQVAALAGHPVKLLDSREGAAAQAVTSISKQLSKLAEKGKITAETAETASMRLMAVSNLQDLADCGLVVEAIVEKLEAKQQLYAQLESIVSTNCLFGTNTSSISVTAIGSALQHPGRLAGLHFFNPAPIMRLVEVVSGLASDPEVLQTLLDTATAWGKTAVLTRSTPGFIVNRVARPFYAEGLRLSLEGAGDHATIDAILRESGGFRMGPFELMDLIGHDVNLAVTKSVWQAFYYDQRFLPSLEQQELVDAGFLGRKTGRGFYSYAIDAPPPVAQSVATTHPSESVQLFGKSPATQAFAHKLQAAGHPYQQLPAHTDGRIAQVGSTVLFQTDGRTATQRANMQGLRNVVLVDLALDYHKATRLALTAALQAEENALGNVAAMLQAAGYTVSALKDIPGMAVMRTVAMLANEAADAINQGVCDAHSVDVAMRLGVNYPQGPITWAVSVGLAHIQQVLQNLAAVYGEDRYRCSPWIQQTVAATEVQHG